jgi:hypothetical protein
MRMSIASRSDQEPAKEGEDNQANLFQAESPHKESGAEFMPFLSVHSIDFSLLYCDFFRSQLISRKSYSGV